MMRRWLVSIGIALATAGPVCALPDWIEALADTAPPLPDDPGRDQSRVLLRETVLSLDDKGMFAIRQRSAIQAFTQQAEQIGVDVYTTGAGEKVKKARAWHIPPGKRAERSTNLPIEIAVGDQLVSDSKHRIVGVSNIERGSLVFFEFDAVADPLDLAYSVSFGTSTPALRLRFELITPPGWEVTSDWLRRPGPDAVVDLVDGRPRHVWEWRDPPAVRADSLGDDLAEIPVLRVRFVPTVGAPQRGRVFRSWNDVASWYQEVSSKPAQVTPPVQAAVSRITKNLPATAGLARVVEIARYVRDQVRYVSQDLGPTGGYTPDPAAETLANQYGDCKDKATLLKSMLEADGRAAHVVLVNLGTPGTVSEKIPTADGFNHLVTAVELAKDEPVPEALQRSVVDVGDLGRMLIIDATQESLPIGAISFQLSGQRAMLVAAGRGVLLTLPEQKAEDHRVLRTMTIAIGADQSLTIERTARYYGINASRLRESHAASAQRFREVQEQAIRAEWIGATFNELKVEAETPDGAFVMNVSFRVPPSMVRDGRRSVPLFEGASGRLQRTSLTRRNSAVVYDNPWLFQQTTTVTGLPAGATLVAAREARRGDGWEADGHVVLEGNQARGELKLLLGRQRFEESAFAELKKMWAAMTSQAAAQVEWPAP